MGGKSTSLKPVCKMQSPGLPWVLCREGPAMHWRVESSALLGLQPLVRAVQGNSAPESDVILMTSALDTALALLCFPGPVML